MKHLDIILIFLNNSNKGRLSPNGRPLHNIPREDQKPPLLSEGVHPCSVLMAEYSTNRSRLVSVKRQNRTQSIAKPAIKNQNPTSNQIQKQPRIRHRADPTGAGTVTLLLIFTVGT